MASLRCISGLFGARLPKPRNLDNPISKTLPKYSSSWKIVSQMADLPTQLALSPTSSLKIQKGDITKWFVDGSSDAIVSFSLSVSLSLIGFDLLVFWCLVCCVHDVGLPNGLKSSNWKPFFSEFLELHVGLWNYDLNSWIRFWSLNSKPIVWWEFLIWIQA